MVKRFALSRPRGRILTRSTGYRCVRVGEARYSHRDQRSNPSFLPSFDSHGSRLRHENPRPSALIPISNAFTAHVVGHAVSKPFGCVGYTVGQGGRYIRVNLPRDPKYQLYVKWYKCPQSCTHAETCLNSISSCRNSTLVNPQLRHQGSTAGRAIPASGTATPEPTSVGLIGVEANRGR